MQYLSLAKKPTITLQSDAEGTTSVQCLDLLAKNVDVGVNLATCSICKVSEAYVGRPDLISFVYYGTDQYGDVICKVNEISNPFELNEGMVLFVQSLYEAQEYAIKISESSASTLISKSDSIAEATKDAYKKLKNASRSPNELTVGSSNYVIDRSKQLVFY
jgi:hypothetical protein